LPSREPPIPESHIRTLVDYPCAEQPGLEAQASEINGAEYNWSIIGGKIMDGRNTPRILWQAGSGANTTLKVNITLGGNVINCSKEIQVNNSCIYLSHCDDLNRFIKNNTELRLLCDSCNSQNRYGSDLLIEGIHDFTIKSACSGTRMVGLNRAVKVGNSTRITIEGLDIENSDILISTDNLTNSYIQNNVMKNTNQSPCIGIYMNDSHKIRLRVTI